MIAVEPSGVTVNTIWGDGERTSRAERAKKNLVSPTGSTVPPENGGDNALMLEGILDILSPPSEMLGGPSHPVPPRELRLWVELS